MFELDARLLARIQFGFTISFHIVFPGLTIGLASYLAVLEGAWLYTKQQVYLDLYQYWSKIFAVAFGMGLRVTLALSPLKGDLMELAIQKCTELGVAEIRPVITVRTDAAARPALQGSRQERWDKVASGAAGQCGRALVPEVAPTAPLAQLLALPFPGRKVLLWEARGQRPLRELAPPGAEMLMLVGPAGRWEEREVEQILAAGFEPASLGPRILRAETAAMAAVAAVQALWGDLG